MSKTMKAEVLPLYPELTMAARHEQARLAADRFLQELTRIYDRQPIQFTRPEDIKAIAAADLVAKPSELMMAYWLNTRHQLLTKELMAIGTIDSADVAPRNFVRSAITHNAAAVIIAHQHPSGSPEPSAADRALTMRIRDALSLVDVCLLDHIVVGDSTQVSLASRGFM